MGNKYTEKSITASQSDIKIYKDQEAAKKASDKLKPSSFQCEMVKLTIDPKVHSVSFMSTKNSFLKSFACVIALYPTVQGTPGLGKSSPQPEPKMNKPVSFIGSDMILDRAFFRALEKYRGQ